MSQQNSVQRYSLVKTPFLALVLSLAMSACGGQQSEVTHASSAATEKAVATAPPPPMDVLGVTIGQPLDLPKCKPLSQGLPTSRCLRTKIGGEESILPNGTYEVDIPMEELPQGILTINATLREGKVFDINIDTMEVFQVDIQKMLVDKWGKPTQANVTDLQNGFGAKFQSIESHWVFPQMRMLFLGRSYGDEGTIVFQSLPRPEEPKKPTSL